MKKELVAVWGRRFVTQQGNDAGRVEKEAGTFFSFVGRGELQQQRVAATQPRSNYNS